ncbi:hypothetical protein I0C86_23500 [Plantactinospora sp. S1510]|uniref:Right handed beta helix domain-containing protein n=1 Tax=Plantactinospora alkalitolerans TaxID=2789879 RepID=A0ABS0H0C1_9ACTN|nr:hypothetical protein [Plantactinospora alkalitolerans]MBF9131906.1 hypothetical protein [Plantactinospora alkalitolerans]
MSTPPTPPTDWPGPTTTGVPSGTVLVPSGPLNLRTDGQDVSGLDIIGSVNVYAKNVVLRSSRITCTGPGFAIRTFDSATGLLIEDVEINGDGETDAAVGHADYTLRRVNIHDVINGLSLGTRTTVVDSWIHDLAQADGAHNDCLQTSGADDIVVRHNRLDAYQATTGSPMNSCLSIQATADQTVRSLLFEDNYCNGGNYTISLRPDLAAVNLVFRRNTFGRDYRYGVIARPNLPGITWGKSNVWFDTGEPVVT